MLSLSGQTGTTGGTGVAFKCASTEVRTHVPIHVEISAGTATVVIEGRMNTLQGWVTLTTLSASDIQSVLRCTQMRARVTAASGATIKVFSDLVGNAVTAS